MKHEIFDEVVADVISKLPPSIQKKLENVRIEFRFGRRRRSRLMGLYRGVPIGEKTGYEARFDEIIIFVDSHLRSCKDEAELRAEIRKTVLHEIGHHLGLTDDELHDLNL